MGDIANLTTQIHSMKMQYCCSRKQNQTTAIMSFALLRQSSAVDYPKCSTAPWNLLTMGQPMIHHQ